MVQVRLVAGNLGKELRHEFLVVETFLFFRLQIRLRTAHPQHVAMKNDLAMAQRFAVVPHESFQRQRKDTIDSCVYKFSGLAGLLAKEMGQGSIRPHVFAPDDGVANHSNVSRSEEHTSE